MWNEENFRKQVVFLVAVLCLYRQHSSSAGIFVVTVITGAVMMMAFSFLCVKLSLPGWGSALSLLLLSAGTWIVLSVYFPVCFYPEESLTVGIGSLFLYLALSKSDNKKKQCAAFGCFSLIYALLCTIPGWYVFRFFSGYLYLCAVFFFLLEMTLRRRDTNKTGLEIQKTGKGESSLVNGLLIAALTLTTAEQILNSWW